METVLIVIMLLIAVLVTGLFTLTRLTQKVAGNAIRNKHSHGEKYLKYLSKDLF